MIDAIDVSHHQAIRLWDSDKLRTHSDERREDNGIGLLFIARATYGSKPDATFADYISLARRSGCVPGAYHFYRQTIPVDEQLAAFDAQLAAVGGLREGECLPVLDIETNERYDGPFDAARASAECEEMAEVWLARYGGVILYYSALQMPALLKRPTWMLQLGMYQWPADYKADPGDPRITPPWHLHQYGQERVPAYRGAAVDVNVFSGEVDPHDLLIGEAPSEPDPVDPKAEAQRLREDAAEVRRHAESELARADELDRLADAAEVG